MSKQTNEYNLRQITNVWDNLEGSYAVSGYVSKLEFLRDSLGYKGAQSGLSSLCTRLRRYTTECAAEYDRLVKLMQLANELVVRDANIEAVDLDALLKDACEPAGMFDTPESFDDNEVDINADVDTLINNEFDVQSVLKLGFLCDTFVIIDDEPVHVTIPENEDFISIRSQEEFKYYLVYLAGKVNGGYELSEFEKCVMYVMLQIIKNKEKVVVPMVFVGKNYFSKEASSITCGALSTGRFKIREEKKDDATFSYGGNTFCINDYCVYQSSIRDVIGTKFNAYFVGVK